MTTDTIEAHGAAITREAATAYLGGPLYDAIRADGYPVHTVGESLQVSYPGTPAVLATLSVEASGTTRVVHMRSSVASRKRPGSYSFGADGRLNLPGLLANLKREREAMRLELEAQRQQHLAEEAARAIAAGNVAIAESINEDHALLLPSADGYAVPYLRHGLVEPSSTADGHVLLRIRECAIDVPDELGRRLAALLTEIGKRTGKWS